MALIPLFSDFDDWFSPRSVIPSYGYGHHRDNYLQRQWRAMDHAMRKLEKSTGGGQHIVKDKNKFQVALDVHQFSPEELSVVVKGNEVVIEGKHEEKQDEHGYVSRHFVRKYSLPEGHKSEDVISSLSSDGVLTITAPRHPALGEGERAVPIQATGSVHQSLKSGQADKQDESKMQE